MTLAIHFLNVGHGSSIVLDYSGPNGRAFGVVDSNTVNGEAPALRKLQDLGATELSFVCLTHPHADHYSGMYQIISMYKDKIDTFVSFSVGELLKHQPDLKKLAALLRQVERRTDDPDLRRGMDELLRILMWAHGLKHNWLQSDGEHTLLAVKDFEGIEVRAILPPKRAKGDVLQAIRKEDASLFGGASGNELSLALEVVYGGKTIILGGDGTATNWGVRNRFFEKKLNRPIFADVANLPHHGSRHDCNSDVLSQLFIVDGLEKKRVAVTSADGQHHPHPDTIKWLQAHNVEPYCTGLLPMCGAKAINLIPMPGFDPILARWAREVSDDNGRKQPCQGDICVRISPEGVVEVSPEYNAPCSFRGDYDRLFA